MMRSISVLILDGDEYGLLKVLRCLGQAADVTSHILSKNKKTIAWYSRYCKKRHYNASRNNDELVEIIKDIADNYNIDVLLPMTIEEIEFVSKNHDTLSEIVSLPPTPKCEMLKVARDKWSFYCFAKEHELDVSPTILFADQTGIPAESSSLDSIEFPVLLKPTGEMGGRGIIKIDKRSDFYSTIEQKKALQAGQRYIVQSYVPGEDLCLGAFCKKGEILSYVLQKDLSLQNNSFTHQQVMEYVRNDRALEIGKKLVSLMEWDGMAFIDFRIDGRDNSLKLLEVNPRLGRAFLGALSAGVNFPLNLCYSAMGINITDKQREGIRYAHPSAYFKILMSRIKGKKVPVKLKWHESGLRYSVSDPLPEFVEMLRHTTNIKLFSSLFRRKVNKVNNKCIRNESVTHF